MNLTCVQLCQPYPCQGCTDAAQKNTGFIIEKTSKQLQAPKKHKKNILQWKWKSPWKKETNKTPSNNISTQFQVGAIADLDMALVIEPANSLALWRRGEAKRELGDIQGAMGDLKLGIILGILGGGVGSMGSMTSGVEVVRVVGGPGG